MTWIAAHLAPLMFVGLVLLLLTGVPVVFALMACGLGFALAGMALDLMPPALMGALSLRVFGIVSSELLLAIPFFTFMGLVLQRSGMAEDLLETAGQVFGSVRGGMALAVVVVGALLGATTGVVAASVVSMGLISLPVMLRNGYNPRIACGVIASSGTLALVVPPSLVLIIVAEQLGTSVGDMYAAALVPAALLIGLYALLVAMLALWRPEWLPALPPHRRTLAQADGSAGYRSLLVLVGLSAVAGGALVESYPAVLRAIGREFAPTADEVFMAGFGGAVLVAFALSLLDAGLRLHWLSPLARRVAFVLLPPLMLIFLVLGTVYLGIATPSESGALGAVGAVLLAVARRRLTRRNAAQALLETSKLSCMVMFVLIGATFFSHSFLALDGKLWVEQLFADLPGGATGFLVFVTLLIFVLGLFLDFFEIAFVLLPLLAPVAHKLGIDLVWFGILVGVNLQASFMTPPFGFSLLFLRGAAPRADTIDPASGNTVRGIGTHDIYIGILPFVGVQLLVLGLLIAWPGLVMRDSPAPPLDAAAVQSELERVTPPPEEGLTDPLQMLLESLRETR
ncbi:MAG: TRAP transporter large permease subunit [Hydrogenophaga sp.]|uniref:TRAP transporter large permease n=1 Tax=Hydrogenophaga sp. TaxID=1904254 RepID=UPI003D118F78